MENHFPQQISCAAAMTISAPSLQGRKYKRQQTNLRPLFTEKPTDWITDENRLTVVFRKNECVIPPISSRRAPKNLMDHESPLPRQQSYPRSNWSFRAAFIHGRTANLGWGSIHDAPREFLFRGH
jgi:hypothetical protein